MSRRLCSGLWAVLWLACAGPGQRFAGRPASGDHASACAWARVQHQGLCDREQAVHDHETTPV